jgi:hypothetical protein
MKSLAPSINLAFCPVHIWILTCILLTLTACSQKNEIQFEPKSVTTTPIAYADSVAEKKSLNVIVLPPYDIIANAGVSPDITTYIESALRKETKLEVMKFPYQKLINANYHMVYDKKYCREIIEIVDPDIIIMSRLDVSKKVGDMNEDRWDFEVKIYDVSSDQQRKSISGQALRAEGINKTINQLRENLVDDILETKK